MVLSYFCVWLAGMIARIMAKLDNLSFLDAMNVAAGEWSGAFADNFCYFVNEFQSNEVLKILPRGFELFSAEVLPKKLESEEGVSES